MVLNAGLPEAGDAHSIWAMSETLTLSRVPRPD